jgi:hypothetical protein
MKRINITRAAALVGVAGLLGLASTAIAADQKPAAKPAAPAYTDPAKLPKFKHSVVVNATPAQRAAANAARPVMHGQKAYIDSATGRLRPITIEDITAEAKAAAPAAAQGAAANSSPTEFVAADGGHVAMLDESTFVYSVAQIGPDGKVRENCVDQQPNGESALKAAAAKNAEEHSHEK